MLILDHVAKRYAGKVVLSDVSATLPPGLTLLVGPSGAGKSTLLRLLATAERPSGGVIRWNGAALPGATRALRRTLGYAPQAVDLPDDLTAREFALHMAALKGLERRSSVQQFESIADSIGLGSAVDNRIATFSGGMRRRLILAQAMLGSPGLLTLDEPTAELDPDTAARVTGLILERATEAVVVMTTHLTETVAPHAAQVLRVGDGEVLPGE